MTTQKGRIPAWGRLTAFTLTVLCLCNPTTRGADKHDHASAVDPFEPTVTREESALLNTAMRVAETNTTQAIRMLQSKDLSEASPSLDFAIGNLQFQSERLHEAAVAYEAAIKKLPKFRSAIMNLGRVYLMQERTEDAIKLYQQIVVDGQADADILLLLGHALLMENAPVSAESAYRQSLLLRPKHPDAMLGMAKALMRQERYAEGLALVGEILQRDPKNRELWSLRTNAYLSMGKHGEAMHTIEKARRLGCADKEMLATLGDLLLNQDQPEDALRVYEAAFAGDTPSIARMLRSIEGFLMVGDAQGATKMIERMDTGLGGTGASFSENQHTALLRLKAELARQTERCADAVALCEEVLTLDPLDGRTMLMLAELQQDAGRLEDAAMTCERAARVKGYEADALVRQAQIEVQRERYGRAASLLEAAQTFEDRPHVARYLEQVRRMEN
jgi:cytochrome c-type biogenesis protein CcmH/NrfG